jgi:hypothetical protein
MGLKQSTSLLHCPSPGPTPTTGLQLQAVTVDDATTAKAEGARPSPTSATAAMAASSSAAPLASPPSITASPKSSLPSAFITPRRGSCHRLRAGSVKQWREFEGDAGAVKEWREFEDAVRRKDLSRALRFLQSVEPRAGAAAMQVAVPVPPGRDWEVLDTCIDADDMRLVGRAYQFLSDREVLASFGKCKNIGELGRNCRLSYLGVEFSSVCSSVYRICQVMI